MKKIIVINILSLLIISCNSKKSYEITNDSLIIQLENYIQTLNEYEDFFEKKSSITLRIYPHENLVNKYWVMFDYNSVIGCEDYIGTIRMKNFDISLFVEKISDKKLEKLNLIKIHNKKSCKKDNQSSDYNELARSFYIYDGKSLEPYTPKSKYWNPPTRE
jgi:hypothetical protein